MIIVRTDVAKWAGKKSALCNKTNRAGISPRAFPCATSASVTTNSQHSCATLDRIRVLILRSHEQKKPRSIPFDDLMTVIGDTLRQYYDRAVNALGWEGGYIGTTYDADDLIQDLCISENESVLQAIRDALGDDEWCDENPYGISGVEAYESAWEHFCHAVKHETRYFFSSRDDSDDLEVTPAGKVLREISGIIEEQGLITTVPPTALFHRVRVHPPSEHCNDWRALGSPPPARTEQSHERRRHQHVLREHHGPNCHRRGAGYTIARQVHATDDSSVVANAPLASPRPHQPPAYTELLVLPSLRARPNPILALVHGEYYTASWPTIMCSPQTGHRRGKRSNGDYPGSMLSFASGT